MGRAALPIRIAECHHVTASIFMLHATVVNAATASTFGVIATTTTTTTTTTTSLYIPTSRLSFVAVSIYLVREYSSLTLA